MKNKDADKNGRHIREGYRERIEDLNREERRIYNKCLHLAGLDKNLQYNKKLALEYFNSKTIPINDAIKRFDDIEKKWHSALEKLGDLMFDVIVKNRKRQYFGSLGGRKSSRKPNKEIMRNAIMMIMKIRIERNYPDSYLFEGHTKLSLYNSLKEKGFNGTLSWVKKHFDTITKVSVSSIK